MSTQQQSPSNDDFLTANIRVLSVNDIYTTTPLPLSSTNILEGAVKAVNIPQSSLDPTPLDSRGRPNHHAGGEVPVVLPIGGLDILRTVIDTLSNSTTIEGANVQPINTLSFLNGDILGGSLFAEHFKGESMGELLNEITPSIVNIGNHEFDAATPQLEKIMSQSRYPWLGENITVTENSVDSDGNTHSVRNLLNVPACLVIDFLIKEDDDVVERGCVDVNNTSTMSTTTITPKKPTNATVVGRYRNVILELLIANMMRGRCDINDYNRFLKASAEQFHHIKETIPSHFANTPTSSNISTASAPTSTKAPQYYLYRIGILSVCTQFTPNLSFPSPNTTFEKPEIYALLLSLLLKTIGCHSIFLASHLSLAGDMKIAQLSREFTRMLKSYTKHSTQLPSSLLQPSSSSTSLTSPTPETTPLHFHNDPLTAHSSYTLIDTIFGGHEHEPIVMQYTEFDRSGVIVDESGGDAAQADTKQHELDELKREDSHDAELKPPSLEHIASLSAPISPYIIRENINYDSYDGPVVVKAGMNNQYTAVCDFMIHIPRHACVNHGDHYHPTGVCSHNHPNDEIPPTTRRSSFHGTSSDDDDGSTTNITPTDVPLPYTTTSTQQQQHKHNPIFVDSNKDIIPSTSLKLQDHQPITTKLNDPVLFHDSEFSFTLHSDIIITFNIIKHLITTTFLEQNNLKKTSPLSFLTSIFKPFVDTPIYMHYLAEIITQVKQNTDLGLLPSTPSVILPTPIPTPLPSPAMSFAALSNMSTNSVIPISPAPSLGLNDQFLMASLESYKSIHSDLLLPQYNDVLARIHDPKKLQGLFTIFNETLTEAIQTQAEEEMNNNHSKDSGARNTTITGGGNTPHTPHTPTVQLLSIAGVGNLMETDTIIPGGYTTPVQDNRHLKASLETKNDDVNVFASMNTGSNSNPVITSLKKSTSLDLNFLPPLSATQPAQVTSTLTTTSLPTDAITTTNKAHQFSEDLPSPTSIALIPGEMIPQALYTNTTTTTNPETFLNYSSFMSTALQDGIMPVPIPHQSDFALSPLHYIQFHNHTRIDNIEIKTKQKQEQDENKLQSSSNSSPTVPIHPTLRRYYNHDPTSTTTTTRRLVHHPSHVYTKFQMYLLPNIQLPAYFPPQLIAAASIATSHSSTSSLSHSSQRGTSRYAESLIPSNILKIHFPTHQPSHEIIAKWSAQLQKDISQGRDLEQIICHLNTSLDTRSQYGRTQGGVSGPNLVADAMEWFGEHTSRNLLEYQEELYGFIDNHYEKNVLKTSPNTNNIPSTSYPTDDLDLDTIDAGDLPTPPAHCPVEWMDLTDILIKKSNKIKGVIACINGGFLRGDKYYAKGSNLTLGDVLAELPFPKTALHALIYGEDLIRAMNQQLTLLPTATGAFPHFSSNVTVEYVNLPIPASGQQTNQRGLITALPCSDGNDTHRIGSRRYDDPTNPFYVRTEPTVSTTSNANANSNTTAPADNSNNNALLAHTPSAPEVPRRVISFKIDGKDIEPKGLYLITSTQFILWGGDGLTSFLRSRLVHHIDPDRRFKVIGDVTLLYMDHLKNVAKQGIENDKDDFVLEFTPSKRATMHRIE